MSPIYRALGELLGFTSSLGITYAVRHGQLILEILAHTATTRTAILEAAAIQPCENSFLPKVMLVRSLTHDICHLI